jgi:hypothetical protein
VQDAPDGSVELQLRKPSFAVQAELTDGGGGEPKTVVVLPHLYASDLIFGASDWVLTCRKSEGGGRTEWLSGGRPPPARPPPGGGAGAGGGWV